MREIKFRGKSEYDKRKWIFGNLAVFDSNLEHANIQDENYIGHNVIFKTVGQFTGEKDNTKLGELTEKERSQWTLGGNMTSEWKGKEIYEGDIVIDEYKCKQEIIFKQGKFCLNNFYNESLHTLKLKVIGNIHEKSRVD